LNQPLAATVDATERHMGLSAGDGCIGQPRLEHGIASPVAYG
jgi:hypothetical protein